MHGTAHLIWGLMYHDVGLYTRTFDLPVWCYTCEPGDLILAEEGIGCRLENDYLITSNDGDVNLSEAMPIEIEEIEALIKTIKCSP